MNSKRVDAVAAGDGGYRGGSDAGSVEMCPPAAGGLQGKVASPEVYLEAVDGAPPDGDEFPGAR